jgi:riboflavin-specific deaminase-like protein
MSSATARRAIRVSGCVCGCGAKLVGFRTMTLLEPLLPAGPPATATELLVRVRPRERAHAARPFTYVNMIATADGRAALKGRTSTLGDDADLEMLLELRTLADAVLIGPGTLRAEGYDTLVRTPERRARRAGAGQTPTPVAVVISRSLDLPWNAGLFAARDQPVLVYTGEGDAAPPEVAAPVELVRLPDPAPAAVLADLRARGIAALLCEGGPTLNRALLEAGVVDELFLTLAPLLTGDDHEPAIVSGGSLSVPVPLSVRWVLRAGDELFLRYAVAYHLSP